MAYHIRKELELATGIPVTKSELQQMRSDLHSNEIFVKRVKKQMAARLKVLELEDKAAARNHLDDMLMESQSVVQRRRINKIFRDQDRQRHQAMLKEVQLAILPKRVYLASQEHKRITLCFGGGPLIRRLKAYCYSQYCVTTEGGLQTQMSRNKLVLCRHLSLCVGLLYLLACTFYIFLYAVSVADNAVINSILMTVGFSTGVQVTVTGPVFMLLTAGLLPWLAVSLISREVRRQLDADKDEADVTVEFEHIYETDEPMTQSNPLATAEYKAKSTKSTKKPENHEDEGIELSEVNSGPENAERPASKKSGRSKKVKRELHLTESVVEAIIALPPVQTTDWKPHQDQWGRTYYFNKKTNESSWGEYDDNAWEQRRLGNRLYFYNVVTGRSAWQKDEISSL